MYLSKITGNLFLAKIQNGRQNAFQHLYRSN